MAKKTELQKNVETLARKAGQTELEIITQLQTAAAIINDEELLEELCELKWKYIED